MTWERSFIQELIAQRAAYKCASPKSGLRPPPASHHYNLPVETMPTNLVSSTLSQRHYHSVVTPCFLPF